MSKMSMSEIYSEPEAYGLPRKGITLNSKTAALVVVDPQVDFLSPQGIGWEVFKDSITENNTVENLEALFKLAKEQHLPVFVSPHYYFPHDHKWVSTAPGETFMHSTGMFDRQGPLNVDNFENSGADFGRCE
ncbi:isochorismatase family protein [Citrobacter gillenii]|uniref:isochorismatase family protein n=1 Tax=Citrobacter gillenii TaxID=67828 RepID=UPI0022E75162|nr:isochorismatase family protein [Citrobacter gillenii]